MNSQVKSIIVTGVVITVFFLGSYKKDSITSLFSSMSEDPADKIVVGGESAVGNEQMQPGEAPNRQGMENRPTRRPGPPGAQVPPLLGRRAGEPSRNSAGNYFQPDPDYNPYNSLSELMKKRNEKRRTLGQSLDEITPGEQRRESPQRNQYFEQLSRQLKELQGDKEAPTNAERPTGSELKPPVLEDKPPVDAVAAKPPPPLNFDSPEIEDQDITQVLPAIEERDDDAPIDEDIIAELEAIEAALEAEGLLDE